MIFDFDLYVPCRTSPRWCSEVLLVVGVGFFSYKTSKYSEYSLKKTFCLFCVKHTLGGHCWPPTEKKINISQLFGVVLGTENTISGFAVYPFFRLDDPQNKKRQSNSFFRGKYSLIGRNLRQIQPMVGHEIY